MLSAEGWGTSVDAVWETHTRRGISAFLAGRHCLERLIGLCYNAAYTRNDVAPVRHLFQIAPRHKDRGQTIRKVFTVEKEIERKILAGRHFMRCDLSEEEFVSDQMLKKPQPPLVKAAMGEEIISLPRDFETLPLNNDVLKVLAQRKSSRVYTREPVTLLELSFLLWA